MITGISGMSTGQMLHFIGSSKNIHIWEQEFRIFKVPVPKIVLLIVEFVNITKPGLYLQT